MYIPRAIEPTIKRMLKEFKVILVTGARQVGKTTVLQESMGDSFHYVSLEDLNIFAQVSNDPLLFFKMHNLPLIIDEVQRAPQLFQTIKFEVDQSKEYGQIALTGSQTYELMQGVSESLAGRIGILEMSGLTLREILRTPLAQKPYIPSLITSKEAATYPHNVDIWSFIHRGAMPRLYAEEIDWNTFWSSYTQTYLERDVRTLSGVKDEKKFGDFMIACAARTGCLFNASSLANEIDVDYKTIQSWVSILQASGIIRLLYPFSQNVTKRVSKTPKLYFMDMGLVSYLTRWTGAEQLKKGALAGQAFETQVVSEILKTYMNTGSVKRDVWFYRDGKAHEIDVVIQDGHVLHPVEIKLSATVSKDAIKNFAHLEGIKDFEVGFGHVICQVDEPVMLSDSAEAVPIWAI